MASPGRGPFTRKTMSRSSTPQIEAYGWTHFVGLSCEQGGRWIEEYLRHAPVVDMNYECLVLLKRRRFGEASEHLRRFRARVDAVEGPDLSVRAVLERWYQAVYGYYRYCLEEYEEAEQAMILAHDAVAEAIERQPCLLPMANHCHEFRLHRARIARNLRRWTEMQGHVDEVRAMFRGERPYCVLKDGRGIALPEIKRYYAALPALSEGEREAVAYVLDDDVRMRDFGRFVHELARLPGFVIVYP